MFRHHSISLVCAGLLVCLSSPATANLGDQWYVGGGYANALLSPVATDATVSLEEEIGTGATVFFGRDFDERSSAQVQLYSFGDAIFSDETVTSYAAADLSLLFRFYDSRDNKRGVTFGTSFYGRFGMGYLDRETELPLDTSSEPGVYFGIGAGLETYFTNTFGIRGEIMYHEADVASGNISLVARFGGRRSRNSAPAVVLSPTFPTPQSNVPRAETISTAPAQRPQAAPISTPQPRPTNQNNQLPEVAIMVPADEQSNRFERDNRVPTPTTPSAPLPITRIDSDRDGVLDDIDRCKDTKAYSSVNTAGCSPLNQIAQNLRFFDDSPLPLESAEPALAALAIMMRSDANKMIEIAAHTDTAGDRQKKSLLTKQRLLAIGIYLVQRGVSQDRLVLRSYGSTRPIADNGSKAGQRANNRIEITERF